MAIHKLSHCTVQESSDRITIVYKNVEITLTDLMEEHGLAGTRVYGAYQKFADAGSDFSAFVNVGCVPNAIEAANAN